MANTPARNKRKPKLHPAVRWLRSIGPAALAFGWGGLLLADWFWVAVPSIYLGFGALAVDALLEPDLRERPKWRIRAVVVIVGLAALFSWGVVFVPANLGVSAWMTDGEYPAGTNISGIAWRPEFTEVDVDIANDTDLGYEDLNIVIRPTEAIAEISQSTSVPGVSFQDANGESVHLLEKNLGSGSSKAFPLVLIATDAGYRVRCPRLGPHTDLRMVMALADIKWNPHINKTIPMSQQLADHDYMLKTHADNFSSYWYGYKNGDDFAPRPTSSEWIKVNGSYTAMHRKRCISQKIDIGGNMTIKPPQLP